jgi:hypothetical protein
VLQDVFGKTPPAFHFGRLDMAKIMNAPINPRHAISFQALS